MAVFRNSRYRSAGKYQVTDKNGDVERVMEPREFPTKIFGCIPHLMKAEDTFESLAFKYYGDGNKWYVIADANPQVFFPLDAQPGMVISIPPKSYAGLV